MTCRNLLLIVSAALAFQCGHGDSLSREEMGKLDPGLRQLFAQPPPEDASYDVSVRSDGRKEYGVIIRSDRPQDLRDAGIKLGSVFGDVITARVTVDELRRIVSLPGVRSVEQGNRNEIQH